MSNELDNVARALHNGHIPQIWRRLAPATLKTLGNWMIHFQQRYHQYNQWVRVGPTDGRVFRSRFYSVPCQTYSVARKIGTSSEEWPG